MTWVYIRTEPGVYTVGFYGPDGKWHTDSDWSTREEARIRVRYLNGGSLDENTMDASVQKEGTS